MEDFNKNRLALARRRRGMTKTKLAEAIGISARLLTAYESDNEDKVPSIDTLHKIAVQLCFPVSFFFQPSIETLLPDAVSFRALTKMSASQRDQALAAGELAVMISEFFDTRFELPRMNIPNLTNYSPDEAAQAIRQEWQLGMKPISNTINLLEKQGARVFSFPEKMNEIDGFSFWRNGVPYILLSTFKNGERGRMDVAHELGHLVLHQESSTSRSKAAETDAKQFASEFLMPRDSVLARAPRGANLTSIMKARTYWGVSTSALTYRMHTLGLLSRYQYQSLFRQIGAAGLLRRELQTMPRESAKAFGKAFQLLQKDGRPARVSVAEDLCLTVEELNSLTFSPIRIMKV